VQLEDARQEELKAERFELAFIGIHFLVVIRLHLEEVLESHVQFEFLSIKLFPTLRVS
jgi:hypothetical protein